MMQASVNDIVIDQFSAFDDDGVVKRSGLAPSGFTVVVWKDAVVQTGTTITITEIGTSGEYKLSYAPTSVGFWKVEVRINVSDEILVHFCQVGIGAGASGMSRVLGLLHENAMIDQQQYDAQGQLVSARVRVFDSKANVPNNPEGSEATGLLYTYIIESRWGGLNRNTMYKLTRF